MKLTTNALITLCIVGILFNPIQTGKNEIAQSEFIIEENDIKKLMLILSHKEFSLILIYSPYCPHCRNFAPHYVRLAEHFHDKIHFYKINGVESKNYREQFKKIRGYPSLWFYYNDKYTEFNQPYSFDYISQYINKNYLFNCESIPYANISTFIDEQNYFLGYFKDQNLLSNYHKILEENKFIVKKCYICKDFKEKTFENTVISFNIKTGVNSFNKYKYISEESKEDINQQFTQFVVDNSLGLYYEYKTTALAYNIKSHQRDLVIFTYSNSTERNEYIKSIYYLSLLNKSQFILFDYVLYNLSLKIKQIKGYKFGKKAGIYLTNKDLNNIVELDDISLIEDTILKHNKIRKENESKKMEESKKEVSKRNQELITSYIKSIYEEKEKEYIVKKYDNARKILFFLLSLVVYSIVFYVLLDHYSNKQRENKNKISKQRQREEDEEDIEINTDIGKA